MRKIADKIIRNIVSYSIIIGFIYFVNLLLQKTH